MLGFTRRCIHMLGFFVTEMDFGHLSSAKLPKSVTEQRDPKRPLLLSVAIRDRKHANRIP